MNRDRCSVHSRLSILNRDRRRIHSRLSLYGCNCIGDWNKNSTDRCIRRPGFCGLSAYAMHIVGE